MEKKNYLKDLLKRYEDHPRSIAHEAALRLTNEVTEMMEEQGLSRIDLARKAELDPAQITRILSAQHNITLATVAKIAAALGADLTIVIEPRKHGSSRPSGTRVSLRSFPHR